MKTRVEDRIIPVRDYLRQTKGYKVLSIDASSLLELTGVDLKTSDLVDARLSHGGTHLTTPVLELFFRSGEVQEKAEREYLLSTDGAGCAGDPP